MVRSICYPKGLKPPPFDVFITPVDLLDIMDDARPQRSGQQLIGDSGPDVR